MCEWVAGSGNVFEDLELPRSHELFAKAALTNRIATLLVHHNLTQTEAARVLGTTRPIVEDLLAGRLDIFSIRQLTRFRDALD